MANNRLQKTGMCWLASLLLLLFPLSTGAKKLSDFYSVLNQSNGKLYFIYPQTGFYNPKNSEPFVFDVTYLSRNDSATVNFTYSDANILSIDSLTLTFDRQKISSLTKKIYVEPNKGTWKYRYLASFSIKDLAHFFDSSKEVALQLKTSNVDIQLGIKSKQWKELAERVKNIFSVIELNR